MSERPILFSAPMVRAILAGTKTQTRRICMPQPEMCDESGHWYRMPGGGLSLGSGYRPYANVGDTLWVRETCRAHELTDKEARGDTYGIMERDGLELPRYGLDGVVYKADGVFREIENTQAASDAWGVLYGYRHGKGLSVPPIHVPRWAARLFLRVTAVRCERVQEISYEDALAEGCADFAGFIAASEAADGVSRNETAEQCARRLRWPQRWYHKLWDEINAKRAPWASNPWVWVVEFERVKL